MAFLKFIQCVRRSIHGLEVYLIKRGGHIKGIFKRRDNYSDAILKILRGSTLGQEIIRSASCGTIHSTYAKTVNIACKDTLLALQAKGSASSPLTLETDGSARELAGLQLTQGMEVSFLEQGIYVNGVCFDMEGMQLWDPDLAACVLSDETRRKRADKAFWQACLKKILPSGGFWDLMLPGGGRWKHSFVAREASHLLDRCREDGYAGNWNGAADDLTELIGLGEGLTPSGDDFLCGVLAASYLMYPEEGCPLRQTLQERILLQLEKTNDISRGFLRCAVQGYFSRPLISLVEGAGMEEVARSFAGIGHSSGADTLSGGIFYMELIKNVEQRDGWR